jgi:hypothetical protein
MVIAWSFSEKDYISNEPRIQSTHSRIHFPWIFVRGVPKQELYIQEDEQKWSTRTRTVQVRTIHTRRWKNCSTRTRTAQVSFQHFQVSYLRTVLIAVFNCSRTVRVTVFTNCVLFLSFFFFLSLFRSRSYPVPHRGERVKQGKVHPRNIVVITYKNFCHFVYCVTFMLLLLQGDIFDLRCLQHLCFYKFM